MNKNGKTWSPENSLCKKSYRCISSKEKMVPVGGLDPHRGMGNAKNGNSIGKCKWFLHLLVTHLKKVTDYLK